MRFATVSLVKAPPAAIAQWAAYHRNSGIDEMHIFFDDPADPAIRWVERTPGVHVYRCDADFWAARAAEQKREIPTLVPDKQFVMLRYILKRAHLSVDWLAHIDSDELIWAPGNTRAALERECRPGLDHLQMPPLEAVPPSTRMRDPFTQVHVFKEHLPELYPEAKERGVRRPFQGRSILRGHRQGKALVRYGSIRTMRIHGPTPSALASGRIATDTATDLRILHYDAGTFADWRRKWQNRAVYGNNMRHLRMRQDERYAEAMNAKGPQERRRRLRDLYRREYMLRPRDERILLDVGLARRIDLDPDLFILPRA